MKTTILNWTWLIGGLCTVVFFAPLVFAPNATNFGRALLLLGVCAGAYRAYFGGLKPILRQRAAGPVIHGRATSSENAITAEDS